MPPRVLCVVAATPSLPLAPAPAGQFTLVLAPTLLFHSGLTAERYEVNTNVVPDPSARWTGAIARLGSFTPWFSSTSLGSFHFVIVPAKMPARTSPVSLISLGLISGRF